MLGKDCVILLWHSLGVPYDYSGKIFFSAYYIRAELEYGGSVVSGMN